MEKFNLNDPKTRNIIIGLVAVVLIAGGVYYAKKQKVPPLTLPDLEGEESSPLSEGGVLAPSEGGGVEAGKPVISDPNKAKFDQALISASDATLAGNHAQAIVYLNKALTYKNSDIVYIRLYSAYNSQGNTTEALKAINKAIELNSDYTDYWNTKIAFMDEKTPATYTELKAVYTAGLAKVDTKTKINLVTSFASVSERGGQINDAISLWEYAKNLYPARAAMYQAEIERLQKM